VASGRRRRRRRRRWWCRRCRRRWRWWRWRRRRRGGSGGHHEQRGVVRWLPPAPQGTHQHTSILFVEIADLLDLPRPKQAETNTLKERARQTTARRVAWPCEAHQQRRDLPRPVRRGQVALVPDAAHRAARAPARTEAAHGRQRGRDVTGSVAIVQQEDSSPGRVWRAGVGKRRELLAVHRYRVGTRSTGAVGLFHRDY
jgi:hypothetical protein